MCKPSTFLHNVWGQFMFQNVLWINSLSPWGSVQILYPCSYTHCLVHSSPQSLGQETVPPAPLPSADKEVSYSIGYTDLNGDLTFCLCVEILQRATC